MPMCPVALAPTSHPRGALEPPCARGSVSCLLAQGSSRAATCLMAPAPTTRPRGSSGTAACPLGSNSHLLAQDSSGVATCPVGGLNGLRTIKVNKYPLAT
jgi:hypothetical protein